MPGHYLALDLGAESGRLIAGTIDDGRLALRELSRFPNVPQRVNGGLHWDFPGLVREIQTALRKAAAEEFTFESISTDSWGVDYVLFDSAGELMTPVFHYRDARSKHGVERAYSRVSWETIFEESGIQFMPINTLFQLCAEDPDRLRRAAFLLGVGDAINFLLCGVPKIEVSMASTFQLYNPRTGGWSEKLIKALELPRTIFPEIVASGTRLGSVRQEFELRGAQVIASCSHDTGAAVAGIPAEGEGWAYLSSGTWSLMGVELPEPIVTAAARDLNFTNEVGFGGTVRLLKNLSGLWLIQECRREWSREGKNLDYRALTDLAAAAPAFRSLINPASEEFLAPPSMSGQIADYCRRSAQPVPESEAAVVRCALESLALLYRRTLRQIETLTGRRIDRLHVVGGGSNNDLLNQFTADALQIPVHAGPAEATAGGNILIQAVALGHLPSLAHARSVARNSSHLRAFTPRRTFEWDRASERFEKCLTAERI
jgi:rhamnulokinase